MITIGMEYEVLDGKQETFEHAVTNVIHAMRQRGRPSAKLALKDVHNARRYLILSQWADKSSFDAFLASPAFKQVTTWAKRHPATRPSHEIYGG